MRPPKVQKTCDACLERVGARFRALVNRYLCQECYQAYMTTGKIPEPDVDGREERRW